MPRKPHRMNYLPVAAYTRHKGPGPEEVLTAWGIQDWGRESAFFEADYVGWCLVHLPDGWMISLEQHDFFLLDQHGQIRGDIRDAFEYRERSVIVLTEKDITGAGITKEEWAEAFPPNSKEPEKPRLELRTAVRFQESFSLGDTYSFWVENPMGQHIFGIYDQRVSQKAYQKKIPALTKRVHDWLAEHYPDWEDHTTYWDAFIEMDERWSIDEREVAATAENLLTGKSDQDLRTLRAEMGNGEKYTDYLVSLQPKLAELFGRSDDIAPFYIAASIAWCMKIEIYRRTGLKYR